MSEGFIDELRNTLDRGAVLSGDDIDARYHHDSAGNPVPKPRAVVRPRTTEDVSTLLRLCHREGVPVTTQGGMTGLVRAALPNAGEIVLSMERMNAIEEVDVSGGVAIAQAGTHVVEFWYRPPHWRASVGAAAAGVVLLLLAGIAPVRRKGV